MVAKRRPEVNGHGLIPGVIEAFEEVERPISTRQKYPTDELIRKLLTTAETGKAFRVKVNPELIRRLHMHFRHAVRSKDFSYHFKTLDKDTMLMWAEKIKGTTK